jgi:hypothetical protein
MLDLFDAPKFRAEEERDLILEVPDFVPLLWVSYHFGLSKICSGRIF